MYTHLRGRAGYGGALMSVTGPGDRADDAPATDRQERTAGGPDGEAARRPASPAVPPPGVPTRGTHDPATPPRDGDAAPARNISPVPEQPPHTPYTGQSPAQETPVSRASGAFPVSPRDPRAGGASAMPPPDAGPYRSGTFPATRPDHGHRSGPLPTPTQSGQWGVDDRRSGPFNVPPPVSQTGPFPTTRTGAFTPAAPSVSGAQAVVTSTGSRRALAPAGWGSLITDRAALAFIGAALLLAATMIAYIAVRYATFPEQIALHFGPAGAAMPDRIGDKRELWTIPLIVGLVLAANVALAWALYHYDRFVARLLTFGSALIAAIAWIVLLTLLRR